MFRLVQPENGLINCCYILNKQLLHTTDIYWSLKKIISLRETRHENITAKFDFRESQTVRTTKTFGRSFKQFPLQWNEKPSDLEPELSE